MSRKRAGRGIAVILVCALGLVPSAGATNGYFTHGYGTANKGLAGAGVALPQDTMAAATNPAGMAFVGKRWDAGLATFNPNRQYTVRGNPSRFPGTFGLNPGKVESDSEIFAIPYLGGNWEVGTNATLGFALYGHGGMNTDYPTNTFFGSSPTGVDLAQLFLTPTYAFRFGDDKHAIGITALLAFQSFEIEGVEAFGAFSSDPASLSNNGHDESTGVGLKIGYLGHFSDRFSFGASYQSKVSMGEFDDYKGLFAEQGGFDIPSTWTVGVAIDLTDQLTFVFDVQEILYSDVAAISNPFLPNLQTARLGDDGGAGFGWEDMTVYKAGLQWEKRDWTWRFGFSTGDQPIPESEVLFNILAPGVMEEHITVGLTKKLSSGRSFSLSLMRALSSSVTGPNPLEVPGLQTIELKMDQWDLEIGYAWGF